MFVSSVSVFVAEVRSWISEAEVARHLPTVSLRNLRNLPLLSACKNDDLGMASPFLFSFYLQLSSLPSPEATLPTRPQVAFLPTRRPEVPGNFPGFSGASILGLPLGDPTTRTLTAANPM